MTTQVITTATVKRLITDIKDIMLDPLSKDGIYYKHDETNMLLGYALIIGPKDTPYAYGNFLFKFMFPPNYPYSPPTVTYHTNDGFTRFNPNLYKNSKVCISLLNTWKGEQWTSCQTIKSILLVLCSLLNDKPLLNEPGITSAHLDMISYNKIIKYRTIDTAINKILTGQLLSEEFEIFNDEIKENFLKNYDNITQDIDNKRNEILSCGIYGLSVKTHYNKLKNELNSTYNNLKSKEALPLLNPQKGRPSSN
jgi:ubiquitin-protein ligase